MAIYCTVCIQVKESGRKPFYEKGLEKEIAM